VQKKRIHNVRCSDVTEKYDTNRNQVRKLISKDFQSDDYRGLDRIRTKKDVKVLFDLMLTGKNVETNV